MVVQVCRTNLYLAIAVFDYNSKFKVQISSMEFSILSRCNKNILPNSALQLYFSNVVLFMPSVHSSTESKQNCITLPLLFLPSNLPSCPLPAPFHMLPSHSLSFSLIMVVTSISICITKSYFDNLFCSKSHLNYHDQPFERRFLIPDTGSFGSVWSLRKTLPAQVA